MSLKYFDDGKSTCLISRLVNWVESNGFAINLKKTKYMIFSRSRNIELPSPLNICNTAIERKNELTNS